MEAHGALAKFTGSWGFTSQALWTLVAVGKLPSPPVQDCFQEPVQVAGVWLDWFTVPIKETALFSLRAAALTPVSVLPRLTQSRVPSLLRFKASFARASSLMTVVKLTATVAAPASGASDKATSESKRGLFFMDLFLESGFILRQWPSVDLRLARFMCARARRFKQ